MVKKRVGRGKIMKVEYKLLNLGKQWTLYNNIIAYSPPPPTHTHIYTHDQSVVLRIPEKEGKTIFSFEPKEMAQPRHRFQHFHNHSSGSFYGFLLILERRFQQKGWRPLHVPERLPRQQAIQHSNTSTLQQRHGFGWQRLHCPPWVCRVSLTITPLLSPTSLQTNALNPLPSTHNI